MQNLKLKVELYLKLKEVGWNMDWKYENACEDIEGMK